MSEEGGLPQEGDLGCRDSVLLEGERDNAGFLPTGGCLVAVGGEQREALASEVGRTLIYKMLPSLISWSPTYQGPLCVLPNCSDKCDPQN